MADNHDTDFEGTSQQASVAAAADAMLAELRDKILQMEAAVTDVRSGARGLLGFILVKQDDGACCPMTCSLPEDLRAAGELFIAQHLVDQADKLQAEYVGLTEHPMIDHVRLPAKTAAALRERLQRDFGEALRERLRGDFGEGES